MIPTTGTGTETDPYVIAEWEDFITHAAETNVYITIVPNTVWDMNILHPEAWTSTAVTIKAKYINGNGLEIRNAYFENCDFIVYNAASSTHTYLYDVKLLNCFGRNAASYTHYLLRCNNNTYNHLSKITITGSFFSTSQTYGFVIANGNLYRNSWNVYVYGILAFTNVSVMDTCNFYIVQKTNLGTVYFNGLTNSLVEGEFNSPISFANSQQNIINAQINNSLATSGTNLFNIVNADKVAETTTIPQAFISVTDEEMKDAEYLRSLGFPIGG